MSIVELIERKRDGGTFTADEIGWIVSGYTADHIPDYQIAALLMAIFLKGMNDRELAAWTEAMLHSGEVLDFSAVAQPLVDKHSTGGVGDKVSIPLAPMVAACGVYIPMMSGRGLGHTGGTLDKLESIPGFRSRLDPPEFHAILAEVGFVLAGQSETLVPADRRMYALRDATGTVPSIPLIASSIMSKKLAEDLDGLVLDVKVGSGAFMKHEPGARKLAETMVQIGQAHDTPVVALLTDMNQPLGREVGNANEIRESIAVLQGRGPHDITELTYRIGEEMLLLGRITESRAAARRMLESAVSGGVALEKFAQVIAAQGGNPAVITDPDLLPAPAHEIEITAPVTGFVVDCNALDIGTAAVRLGAGRATKEDDVDPAVGITVLAKRGAAVQLGDPLARIGYDDRERLAAARPLLERAWVIEPDEPERRPLIIGEVR